MAVCREEPDISLSQVAGTLEKVFTAPAIYHSAALAGIVDVNDEVVVVPTAVWVGQVARQGGYEPHFTASSGLCEPATRDRLVARHRRRLPFSRTRSLWTGATYGGDVLAWRRDGSVSPTR